MKKKKQAYQSSHGAVTIFLVLILVPCMIFVCAFGDVARVNLSQSQAAAAADLAMYSLLSNYDEDLKEWYGLVASCQTIDQFYKVSADYFSGMMTAAGIDGTASDLFTSYLKELQTGKEFADLLQVEMVSELKVGPVADANLTNPAILEDSIVEFMKYRGPVEIVTNVIDRFKELKLLDTLQDAQTDEIIAEAKKVSAQAESDLLKKVLYTYIATEQYTHYYDENAVPDYTPEKQGEYTEDFRLIYRDLTEVTILITKYYSYTTGLVDLTGRFVNIGSLPNVQGSGTDIYIRYGSRFDPTDIGAKLNKEETAYELTAKKASDLTKDYKTYIANLKTAADNIYNACKGIEVPDLSDSDYLNPVYYLMKMQKTISSTDLDRISNEADKLMKAYAKMKLATYCDLPDQTTGNSLNAAMADIEEVWTNYLTYSGYQHSSYETMVSQYTRAINHAYGKTKNFQWTFYSEYCKKAVTLHDFFSAIGNEYKSLYDKLTYQIENLDRIINGGTVTVNGVEYPVDSLAEIKLALQTYITARDTWGEAANKADTDFAKQEAAEYAGQTDGEYQGQQAENALAERLTEDGAEFIDSFAERIKNIRAAAQKLKDSLDGFTYGEKPIYSMTQATAISVAKSVVPTDYTQISPYLEQNKEDGAGYAPQLIQPSDAAQVWTTITVSTGESGNDPFLISDQPAFYDFMKRAFPEVNGSEFQDKLNNIATEEESQQDQQDEAKKAGEASKKADSNYIKGCGKDPLPRKSDSENTFGLEAALSGIVGVVQTLADGNFDEIRDKLYVVEYCMDMFSYSSYNNEGQYKLYLKNNNDAYTHADFKKNGYSYPQDIAEAWAKEETFELPENQSLTNRPINNKHNQINLAEIEYILYGKPTMDENLKESYTEIFTLRLPLNLAAAIQVHYGTSTTTGQIFTGIASSVASLTMGVIPPPVTKLVLLTVLATLETVSDLNRLKAGIPVVLYKAKDENWACGVSVEDIKSAAIGDGTEPKGEKGLYYSDYLYIFMLVNAQTDSNYAGMLKRIGDLIQANMIIQGSSGFQLSKAQCYFQMTGKLRVKPLLLTLPIVDSVKTTGTTAAEVREKTDWCSYDIDVIRGYS